MGDPLLNCLCGVCCDAEKRAALLAEVLKQEGLQTPEAIAAWLFEHFDLAPAGTLQPLFTEVARLARGVAYKGD